MTKRFLAEPRRMAANGSEATRLLLDLDDVAARLSIGRTLVAKHVYAGDLPSLTIGRRRLVALDDLNRFVERRKTADGSLGR
jgi:excisionase family DNA binding protein